MSYLSSTCCLLSCSCKVNYFLLTDLHSKAIYYICLHLLPQTEKWRKHPKEEGIWLTMSCLFISFASVQPEIRSISYQGSAFVVICTRYENFLIAQDFWILLLWSDNIKLNLKARGIKSSLSEFLRESRSINDNMKLKYIISSIV